MKIILSITFAVFLMGCATELIGSAKEVRVISIEQKTKCQFLGLITTEQRLGPDKPGNALKKAYNDAAVFGANAIYIITSNNDWAEGASVSAEAYKCI